MMFSHKHLCTSLLILVVIVLGSGIAHADRFYMSPTGNNTTGDGSRNNPYATLGWIVRNVHTPGQGDTVMVMSGTYPGDPQVIGINCLVRGNPDAFFTIMADPQGSTRPLIDANDLTETCWTFTANLSWPPSNDPTQETAYVRIQGIDFTDAQYHCLYIHDGGNYEMRYPANNFIIEDCNFSYAGEIPPGYYHLLKFAGVDTFLVKDCTFKESKVVMFDIVGGHYGTITNCYFTNTEDSMVVWPKGSIGGGAIYMKGGSNKITVDRCYFKHLGYSGVYIGQSTGPSYFRPPLGTPDGDGATVDYEAKDINVYRSIFVDIANPIAFFASRGGGVYNCTFFSPLLWNDPGEPTGSTHMVKVHYLDVTGGQTTYSRDAEVINNIWMFNSTYGEVHWPEAWTNSNVYPQSSTTNLPSFLFSHNMWYNMANPDNSLPGWDYIASNLYGAPAYDNDFANNPMFAGGMNPEVPEHFQLIEGSPAATAGLESGFQIYDYFNGRYLQDLDYNNRVWSSPRSLGAFGMTVSGAPLSGPNVYDLLPPELQSTFKDR